MSEGGDRIELHIINGKLSPSIDNDSNYEMYVRMKVLKGLEDIEKGRVVSHEEVMKRFLEK